MNKYPGVYWQYFEEMPGYYEDYFEDRPIIIYFDRHAPGFEEACGRFYNELTTRESRMRCLEYRASENLL